MLNVLCKLSPLRSGSHASQLQSFNVLRDVADEACTEQDVSRASTFADLLQVRMLCQHQAVWRASDLQVGVFGSSSTCRTARVHRASKRIKATINRIKRL